MQPATKVPAKPASPKLGRDEYARLLKQALDQLPQLNVKISVARKKACDAYPYFTQALLDLVMVPLANLGTYATSRNSVCYWCPVCTMLWTDEEIAGALVHEAGHIMRDHHGRCEAHCGCEMSREFNVAGDLENNRSIVLGPLKLPGDPLLPEKFGLPDDLLAEEYVDLMRKRAREEGDQPGDDQGDEQQEGGDQGDQGGDDGDDGDQGGGDDGDQGGGQGGEGGGDQGDQGGEGDQGGIESGGPGDLQLPPGSGHCGGCAGNPVEGEPESHPAERSDDEIEATRQAVAKKIAEHVAKNGRGSVPGGWDVWAEQQLRPPTVPWQQILLRLARFAVAHQQGANEYRYDRPSRRQASLGYGPGAPIQPRLRSPVPDVLFAVDTSGSMGTDELTHVLSEFSGLIKTINAEVGFCAIDSQVHTMQTVRTLDEAKQLMKGGGGTSFVPLFEQVRTMRRKPAVLIVATDGCGPAPAIQPHGVRVVWLLVGPYQRKPWAEGGHYDGEIRWGDFVEVPHE